MKGERWRGFKRGEVVGEIEKEEEESGVGSTLVNGDWGGKVKGKLKD